MDHLYRINAAATDQCVHADRPRKLWSTSSFDVEVDRTSDGMLQCTGITRNLSFYLGGKSPSDDQKWTPNLEAVRASIRFAIATGRPRPLNPADEHKSPLSF